MRVLPVVLLVVASCTSPEAEKLQAVVDASTLYVALAETGSTAAASPFVVSAPAGTAAVLACVARTADGCQSPQLGVHAAGSRGDRPLFASDKPLDLAAGKRLMFVAVDAGGTTLATLAAYSDVAGALPTSLPDPALTPGALCTQSDPDFKELRYGEGIAYCNRNVTEPEKIAIGKAYGIDQKDFKLYEFDHYIPLSAGGANTPENIWPQPLTEARVKDQLELDVFQRMQAGTLTQANMQTEIRAWRLPPLSAASPSTAYAAVRDNDKAGQADAD